MSYINAQKRLETDRDYIEALSEILGQTVEIKFTIDSNKQTFEDYITVHVGKYSVKLEGGIIHALRSIYHAIVGGDIGPNEYISFLRCCDFRHDSKVPTFEQIKKHNIGFIAGPTGLVYPTYNLSERTEFVASTTAYDDLTDEVISQYALLYTISHVVQGEGELVYKVRGVLKSKYLTALRNLEADMKTRGIVAEFHDDHIKRCVP